MWVWAGGCEEVSEVRVQAGFSLCVSELLEVLAGAILVWCGTFSLVCLCWEAQSVVTSRWSV